MIRLLFLFVFSLQVFSLQMFSLQAHAAGYAIVMQDEVPLRATPGASARLLAVLAQGETVEVRGERLDYLQVWDSARERGGFVRSSEVRRLELTAEEAPELLGIVRFLRGMPGRETLGIGIAAAYIEAAPAAMLSSQLDVAARYGVRFLLFERHGRVRLCYDGAAYRKMLVMRATEEQRARAMLALSEPACLKPELTLVRL